MSHEKHHPRASTPATPVTLTSRDRELLDTLAVRVRVLTLTQVARTWWGATANPKRQSRERLARLERAGWVETFTATARPELTLAGPLATWKQGGDEPDMDALAYALQVRWQESAKVQPMVTAKLQAGKLFGGDGGRKPRASETTHDLHLSSIYLKLRSENAKLASTWRSEARLAKERADGVGKVPDAMIIDRGQRRVIEFGGSYSARKLREFHTYCAQQKWAYEIW